MPDVSPLERYLDEGEEIIWHGKPRGGLVFRAKDVFQIPAAIFTLALALIWVIPVFSIADFGVTLPDFLLSGMFATIGVLVLGSFLVSTILRLIFEAISMARSDYALTNKRALLRKGIFSLTVTGLYFPPDMVIHFSEGRNGWVKFGADAPRSIFTRHDGYKDWLGPGHPFMFERIDDAASVARMARKVQADTADLW